ncbi:MAG: glutamate--tRNA ligase family protein, partial [bacterium]
MTESSAPRNNFIRDLAVEDVETGRFGRPLATRFPPEPNGFLHIGHAKSICLNFGLARDFDGRVNLRFDDTNPATEDIKYVQSIKDDVRWLGFEWDEERYASDYFEQLYDIAHRLIAAGKAYVDSQNEEEIREGRGSVTTAGTNSPYRDRSPAENGDLLRRMRAGEFEDGAHVVRAKIDMAHPNMIMRDPLLLRIRHAHHYRLGDEWCIYPLYDFAHGLSDAIEGITRSLCTLEFKDSRDIYDWLVREAGFVNPPQQTEFARLELDYTILSKR